MSSDRNAERLLFVDTDRYTGRTPRENTRKLGVFRDDSIFGEPAPFLYPCSLSLNGRRWVKFSLAKLLLTIELGRCFTEPTYEKRFMMF